MEGFLGTSSEIGVVAETAFKPTQWNESTAKEEKFSTAGLLTAVEFAGDLAVTFLALFAGYWIRFESPIRYFGVPPVGIRLHDYIGYIGFAGIVLLLSLAHRRIYDPRRLLDFKRVVVDILTACMSSFALFLSCSLIFKLAPLLSRIYVLICLLISMVGLVAWRRLFHHLLSSSNIVKLLRQKILFVGWTRQTAELIEYLGCTDSNLYDIIGYIEPQGADVSAEPIDAMPSFKGHDLTAAFLTEHRVDMVIVSDPRLTAVQTGAMAQLCAREMVQFRLIPASFPIFTSRLQIETSGGVPVLGISELPLNCLKHRAIKRAIDLVGALVGLVAGAPLILLFGTLVSIESPGPILYRQNRQGRNGKEFNMLKIRSMRIDAEANGTIGWTVKGDPRVLKIGALMRKWNIDELPQFWNVLKGEMSLVGPRPERPALTSKFKHEITHYNARHTVKPGITGWAQVSGLRGDTDLSQRIRFDLFYVENWSIFFDLHVMFLTFFRYKNAC